MNIRSVCQKKPADQIGRFNFKRYWRKKTSKQAFVNRIWSIFRLLLFIGLIFMILYPLIVKFSASIKTEVDMADPSVMFIPKNPTFFYYQVVINSVDYMKTLFKTVGFTLLCSVLQISSCLFVAYGLARFKFKGNRLIFGMTLLTLAIPPQVLLLPLYFRFKNFNLLEMFKFTGVMSGLDMTNSIVPFLLLSVTASAFKNGLYIFLLHQYYRNTPEVLEEAAYIDGCGVFKTFFKIMVPGALPIIISVFLFSFVWQWNDIYYANMLAPDLPLLSNKLFGIDFSVLGSDSDIFTAMLNTPKFFLLILPLLILYIFTQRFFTESIERSGTVG